jgi:hypothetical protein
MANTVNFIPRRQSDALVYAKNMHDVLNAADFDPAAFRLTDADVTELGTALTEAQAAMNKVIAARMEAVALTKALSAPGGAHERLVITVRAIANVARASGASHSVLASMGVRRKPARGTRRSAPSEAPEFSVDGVERGAISVRFRTAGSAQPRARAANTNGVQVAVVNAASPAADGEADTVPAIFLPRSPARLDSTKMPDEVRLYARWVTPRGLTGPWSRPLSVTVL